jgi:xylulokinase
LPNRWHQMGVILSATDALNWYAGITGLTAAELTAELGEDLHAPGAETFLPYLSGERTPHNDAAIRGSFTGLGHDSDRATLTRAVLEGVAFALRDSLEALRTTGTKIEDLIAVGGGSRSRLWLKMIATILGTSIKRPVAGDFGAAFGAARLGLIAATRADPLTVSTPPSISETIQPDTKLQSAFDDAWARYHALYPAIKGTLS